MLTPDELPQLDRLRHGGDQALADTLTEHTPTAAGRGNARFCGLSGRVDVADVLQEAFLEARKRLPRYWTTHGSRVRLAAWCRDGYAH